MMTTVPDGSMRVSRTKPEFAEKTDYGKNHGRDRLRTSPNARFTRGGEGLGGSSWSNSPTNSPDEA